MVAYNEVEVSLKAGWLLTMRWREVSLKAGWLLTMKVEMLIKAVGGWVCGHSGLGIRGEAGGEALPGTQGLPYATTKHQRQKMVWLWNHYNQL